MKEDINKVLKLFKLCNRKVEEKKEASVTYFEDLEFVLSNDIILFDIVI